MKHQIKHITTKLRGYFWPASMWRRCLTIVAAAFVFFGLVSYGIGRWYIQKHQDEPLVIGTTFVANYAESFGLDSKQTLQAILSELNVKQVRLVSYWKDIEPTPGSYDFTELDWQFEMANQSNAKVSLAIGLRQPRWPECHEPAWVSFDSPGSWRPALYSYMEAVVNRYKDNPALQSYELENEFFMTVFGECKDFDRQRLIEEYNLVKQWDPNHRVIISRSNNWVGIPIGQPRPDQFGISIYKRVWDHTLTHRYFEYPLPTWFYAALAGWGELITGRDMVIHELQAEPWAPNKKSLVETTIAEQYKSMDAKRMSERITFAKDTGMRNIDLWGAEWWYWLKATQNDSSVWDTVKKEIAKSQSERQR